MSFERIPAELKSCPQWVLWRYQVIKDAKGNDKFTKVPYSASGTLASVTDPNTWTTFENARDTFLFSEGRYAGIGFVFGNGAKFAGIDIDGHNNDAYRRTVGERVINAFQSYTEVSPSGTGLHIIVYGSIQGSRRHGIEAYSTERFFTMTGNVYRDLPIIECQPLLDELQKDLRPSRQVLTLLNTNDATMSDDEIVMRMMSAKNAAKTMALVNGDGSMMNGAQGDHSGSAIDQAIVNTIQFYSKNVDQIERIWWGTPHAQSRADKMKRQAYRLMTIGQAFDREFPPLDLSGVLAQKSPEAPSDAAGQVREETPTIAPTVAIIEPDAAPVNHFMLPTGIDVYTWPPGLVGEMAQFIYASSARPVRQIAIAAAIALMAGLAGKAWNVNDTGLNHYILLVARTGRGKDAISEGVALILGACTDAGSLAASKFIGPSNINSGQALAKYLGKSETKCFVSIIGEFGVALNDMCGQQANAAQSRLLRELLDLWGKSGASSVVGSNIYSDQKESVEAIKAPAFSFIGESNHENLYGNLNEKMITSGLLPRFLIITYDGIRVPPNKHKQRVPPLPLVHAVTATVQQAAQNINRSAVTNVRIAPDVQAVADEYNAALDTLINDRTHDNNNMHEELWNRVYHKTLRLAALLAVGINLYDPCVTMETWNWARNLVVSDTVSLISKFEGGEINGGEAHKQWHAFLSAIKSYFKMSDAVALKNYRVTRDHRQALMLTAYYLQNRLRNMTAFKESRQDFKRLLDSLIQQAVSAGILRLQIVPGSSATWYQVLDMDAVNRKQQ